MKPSAVVLATSAAIDVKAARCLNDYGDLDDAGVVRALEQVHMQRWGRTDCPAHLRLLTGVAAVVESGRQLRLVELEAQTPEQEASLLSGLFDNWPRMDGALVDWCGDVAPLLMARACRHEMTVPTTLAASQRVDLLDCVAPMPNGHPADRDVVEAEYHRLHDHTIRRGSLVDHAVARYRTWLAWQTSQGTMLAVERSAREDALARELAGQA